jgi:hypothetical protein
LELFRPVPLATEADASTTGPATLMLLIPTETRLIAQQR